MQNGCQKNIFGDYGEAFYLPSETKWFGGEVKRGNKSEMFSTVPKAEVRSRVAIPNFKIVQKPNA